jgi:homospermidine synthase
MTTEKGLKGVDKVGALILMDDNVGWWTGSLMSNKDCLNLFDGKFGPTPM